MLSKQPVLVCKRLTKLYKNGKGIRDVDLAVDEGEVFGFLGPNGAGKSTTIRTLMGFLTPTSGQASVMGYDVATQSISVRANTGYLPSEITLYKDMTGWENVGFALKLRGISAENRAQELADRLGVDLKRAVKSLSRGQKQKVAIIAAIAHDPSVIILDEPTTGLDPLMQEEFNSLIRELASRKKTVFMSSHILSDVENMCERVAIIREGKIVTIDTIETLRKQRRKQVSVVFGGQTGSAPNLAALTGVENLRVDGMKAEFSLKANLEGFLTAITGVPILDLTIQDPSLEEVFLEFYSNSQ